MTKVTWHTAIVTRTGSKAWFFRLGKPIENGLLKAQRNTETRTRRLGTKLPLSLCYLEPSAWPGLWKLNSAESGKFYSLPFPAVSFLQCISGSQSETILLNKPLLKYAKENASQTPDASSPCLPASLEVKLGYVSGSGQWTIKKSDVTSRPKYLRVGSWPSVLSFLSSAARKSPLLESVSIRHSLDPCITTWKRTSLESQWPKSRLNMSWK